MSLTNELSCIWDIWRGVHKALAKMQTRKPTYEKKFSYLKRRLFLNLSRLFKTLSLTDFPRFLKNSFIHSLVALYPRYVPKGYWGLTMSIRFIISFKRPLQTDATLLANTTQHYCTQHVASVCMEPQQYLHLSRFV